MHLRTLCWWEDIRCGIQRHFGLVPIRVYAGQPGCRIGYETGLQTTTYSVVLDFVCYHSDDRGLLLPDHAPEVVERVEQRTLRRDVGFV